MFPITTSLTQLEETGEILEEDVEQATGPEIPVTGLPEPDYTPAADLDKSDWQIVSRKTKSI